MVKNVLDRTAHTAALRLKEISFQNSEASERHTDSKDNCWIKAVSPGGAHTAPQDPRKHEKADCRDLTLRVETGEVERAEVTPSLSPQCWEGMGSVLNPPQLPES